MKMMMKPATLAPVAVSEPATKIQRARLELAHELTQQQQHATFHARLVARTKLLHQTIDRLEAEISQLVDAVDMNDTALIDAEIRLDGLQAAHARCVRRLARLELEAQMWLERVNNARIAFTVETQPVRLFIDSLGYSNVPDQIVRTAAAALGMTHTTIPRNAAALHKLIAAPELPGTQNGG